MPMQKRAYCSACKHSKYITANGKKQLYCRQREAWGQKPYLHADATDATECLDFDPERRQDAFRDNRTYMIQMSKCGMTKKDASKGILARDGPQFVSLKA